MVTKTIIGCVHSLHFFACYLPTVAAEFSHQSHRCESGPGSGQ
jgi:hypothetical protein